MYAHLPLIVDADRGQAVEAPRRGRGRGLPRPTGYLPEALLNYLALLGWAPADDGDEILARDELVAEFDLDRVTHAAAVSTARSSTG